VYHLLTFKATPETLDELSRILKITDGVMRHMATRRPAAHRRPNQTGTTPPPPVEVAVPAAAPETSAPEAEGGEE
jgi:hypothetical protein